MILGKAIQRLALYIGIALAVLALFAVVIVITRGARVPSQWLALAVFTAGLFWATIRQSREYWAHPTFWISMAGLLVVHVSAFVAILEAYPQWHAIWFVPVVVIEGGLFGAILYLLFGRERQ